MAFDVITGDISTHGVYITAYSIAADITAHGVYITCIALDCYITAFCLDAFDIAINLNLDDWAVGLVILLEWLAVDENLAVYHLKTRAARNVDCLTIVGDVSADAANNCADAFLVDDVHKNLFL